MDELTDRLTMLRAVEPYISIGLREKLREKITMEEKRFNSLKGGATKTPGEEKSPQGLNPAFFERKPLKIGLFE